MAAGRATVRSDAPLVVIVGPTASGKTGVAIELAERFGGEIVCADSRTIYKGMDIGTAKPGSEERERIPHWGIDLVEPGERFTAADFKRYAEQKIKEIRSRGHVPFLVGGTGLYVDAILFDYEFGGRADMEMRNEFNQLSLEQLIRYCIENNIKLPENRQNKQYVIRSIEQKGISAKRRKAPISNSIIVGIATDKVILDERIAHRTEQLFNDGVVEEAIILGKKYGWESGAFTGNVYRVIKRYLLGEISQDEMKEKNTTLDRQLAKRQRTWFKRNQYIHWLPLKEVTSYVGNLLAKR